MSQELPVGVERHPSPHIENWVPEHNLHRKVLQKGNPRQQKRSVNTFSGSLEFVVTLLVKEQHSIKPSLANRGLGAAPCPSSTTQESIFLVNLSKEEMQDHPPNQETTWSC